MQEIAPLVSIGIPVYNGAKYIAETLDSILAQTLTDFEVIVSDNASTDNTREIVEAYIAKDSRIRYYRNESNIGAAPNYNRTFELSRGKYFHWNAHDDLIAPTYLEKCVAILEADPGIVLAHTRTEVIGPEGQVFEFPVNPDGSAKYSVTDSQGRLFMGELDVYDRKLDSNNRKERFFNAMDLRGCYETFGLIRADALRRTHLQENYYGTDTVMLTELALLGRFYVLREKLFMNRRHPDQSYFITSLWQRSLWNNGKKKFVMPTRVMRMRGFMRAIRESDMSLIEKATSHVRLIWRYLKVKRYGYLLDYVRGKELTPAQQAKTHARNKNKNNASTLAVDAGQMNPNTQSGSKQ